MNHSNLVNCFYATPVSLLFVVVLPYMNIFSAGRRQFRATSADIKKVLICLSKVKQMTPKSSWPSDTSGFPKGWDQVQLPLWGWAWLLLAKKKVKQMTRGSIFSFTYKWWWFDPHYMFECVVVNVFTGRPLNCYRIVVSNRRERERGRENIPSWNYLVSWLAVI